MKNILMSPMEDGQAFLLDDLKIVFCLILWIHFLEHIGNIMMI